MNNDLYKRSDVVQVMFCDAMHNIPINPIIFINLYVSQSRSESLHEFNSDGCVSFGSCSVHAATAVKADERERLEKLVRYMARPAIADDRIHLVSLSELHLHLTRHFGVLALGSKHRANLPDVPADPATGDEQSSKPFGKGRPGLKGHKRMSWADLLKRTFQIDVVQCFQLWRTNETCGKSPSKDRVCRLLSKGRFGPEWRPEKKTAAATESSIDSKGHSLGVNSIKNTAIEPRVQKNVHSKKETLTVKKPPEIPRPIASEPIFSARTWTSVS